MSLSNIVSESQLFEVKNPPLTEVAFSAQFERPINFNVKQLGKLCEYFENEYPEIEQHPPSQSVIERKGVRQDLPNIPKIEFLSELDLPRLWLLTIGKEELIQVQPDKFVRNWRKLNEDTKYPRFTTLKPKFESDLKKFLNFLEMVDLKPPKYSQCELTYVNQIQSSSLLHDHTSVHNIYKFWEYKSQSPQNLVFEDVKHNLRYSIYEKDDFIGRLHISSAPAFRKKDDCPLYVLTLTARGRPIGDGVEGVLNFFDLGRKLIVNTFGQITEDKLHAEWDK